MADYRVAQAVVLALIAIVPILAQVPAVAVRLRARPGTALAAIVAIDVVYLIWATLPYVPFGVDQSYFVLNAHVFRGADLFLLNGRPPLPALCAALTPWHPPLLGIVGKQVATVFAYRLAVRPFGVMPALLVAWLTAFASRLSANSAFMLSEPYGAAAVAVFAWLAVQKRPASAGLVAGFGFVCRWPLGMLLPLAGWLGLRVGGWRSATVACALFWVPFAVLIGPTGADPLSMMQDRGEWGGHGPLETLLFYLKPDRGFGVGAVGFVLVCCTALSARLRASPEVVWAAGIFATHVAAFVYLGETVVRFFVPVIPLLAVLIVGGALALRERLPLARLAHRAVPALAVAGICVALAVPVRPPKVRWQRMRSPLNAVRENREQLLDLLDRAPLHSDFNMLALSALLAHPVHAVLTPDMDPSRHHPAGISLDWEGQYRAYKRSELPEGSLYLTYDAGGREPLWSDGRLALVRW